MAVFMKKFHLNFVWKKVVLINIVHVVGLIHNHFAMGCVRKFGEITMYDVIQNFAQLNMSPMQQKMSGGVTVNKQKRDLFVMEHINQILYKNSKLLKIK